MPAKKPQPKYIYMNAYEVVRRASQPGPHAKVVNYGTALGSLRYPAGNAYEKKKAMRELYLKYSHVIRMDGKIYRSPFAKTLWIFQESHPAENWCDADS